MAEGDRAFLLALYASTRAAELALVPWDDAAKQAFVEHQFAAQDGHYRAHYDGATFDVVEVDGEPAGRLIVHRGERDVRIVDVTLLPPFRGRGTGTALLGALIDEAEATGRTVSIHVEVSNPARALYERLGFAPVREDGVHLLMERLPGAARAAAS